MAAKTSGQKGGRTSVKNLKGNLKELTAKEQKKVKGGLISREATLLKGSIGGRNHNETLVHDIVR